MEDSLPLGPGSDLSSVGVDHIPVDLTASSVDINLFDLKTTLSLPEVADDPEDSNDGNSEPG